MKKIAAPLKTILKVSWLSLAIPTTLLVCTESAAFVYHSARKLMVGDQLSTYVRAQVAKMPRDGYASPADQSWFAAYWKEFNEDDGRFVLSRRLSELLAPQWLTVEVASHVERLLSAHLSRADA